MLDYELIVMDRPLFFIGGGGGGVPFLGLADNFFLKNNAVQTIFLLDFVMKTIFYDYFKKHNRLFYRSFLK